MQSNCLHYSGVFGNFLGGESVTLCNLCWPWASGSCRPMWQAHSTVLLAIQRLRDLRNYFIDARVPHGHSRLQLQFKDKLKAWRLAVPSIPKISLKEAAALLDMDYPSYRKYECGKRTPCKLARRELERKMIEKQNGL